MVNLLGQETLSLFQQDKVQILILVVCILLNSGIYQPSRKIAANFSNLNILTSNHIYYYAQTWMLYRRFCYLVKPIIFTNTFPLQTKRLKERYPAQYRFNSLDLMWKATAPNRVSKLRFTIPSYNNFALTFKPLTHFAACLTLFFWKVSQLKPKTLMIQHQSFEV